MKITLTGKRELSAKMRAAVANAPNLLGRGLREEGETIMTRSKRLVPVDLGTLRASGFVDGPDLSGNTATVILGYGGAAQAYALIQHERTDYRHTSGQAKFLEQPVNEAANGFSARLARRIGRKIL